MTVAADPFNLFGVFGDFFGHGALPPESVPRKILDVPAGATLNRAGIMAGFRFRVRQLRPDLTDTAADGLRLRDLAGDERAADEVRFDIGSKEEQLAELLWAREFLLARIPKPVTAANGHTGATFSSRNGRKAAPPVTAADLRTRVEAGTRNARVLADVTERQVKIAKRWSWGEWKDMSDAEIFTRLAIDARLICASCHAPLEGTVYLYRTTWSNNAFGDNLRARCAGCWETHRRGKYVHETSTLEPRRCRCGIDVHCTGDTYYSTGWWNSGRARSCSPLCGREQRNDDARARRLSRRTDRKCVVCDETFTPARADGRYCSSACRQDAYRKRKVL